MVDTLSQSEIDALLSALSTGEDEEEDVPPPSSKSAMPSAKAAEEPERKSTARSSGSSSASFFDSDDEDKPKKRVTSYDFRRQTKFSKEQLGTIQLIHETFARLVGTDLSTRLRAFAQATIIAVEQRTFEEMIHSIYNPTFITIIRSDNLDGKMLIDINLNIVFTILDRLLGGNGTPLGILRQVTEVEKQIMTKVMASIVDRLREAWINIIDLAPAIELVESNPQFAQIVPPSEVVLSITIEIKIHDVTGVMTLCIPYNTVEPIVHKFNAASWFAAVRKEPMQTNVDAISHQVKDVHLPVVAELGAATVSLQDILGLGPGDIIITDQLVKNDLNIRVGNLVKYKGRPGILGRKMAISITDQLEPPNLEEELE
jgi:flagellar motor switch protein FliM